MARWLRAFCSGEIVSQDSLAEMSAFADDYGLGLMHEPQAGIIRHAGEDDGYASWAGCLLDGAVSVVLANRFVDDIAGMAAPLVITAREAADG